MTGLLGFTKKEFMETVRTGKMLLLLILFILFGIMSPAIAKLTPWMMDMMSESLAETGIMITEIKVDDLTSWTQFYKNVPIAFLVFFLMFSGILTTEYQKGTLINMITKGLERWKIVIAKWTLLFCLWTAGYWICYGITYGYNAYFWGNKICSHIFFSAFCLYLLGIWMLSLLMLLSVFFQSNSAVMVSVLIIVLFVYLFGLLSDKLLNLTFLKKCLPTQLLASSNLLTNITGPKEYFYAVFAVIMLTIFDIVIMIVCFSKKRIG